MSVVLILTAMLFRCDACGGLNRAPEEAPKGKNPVCGQCKKALDTSGAPQNVDSKGLFAAVGQSEVPVLVDFWAPWCGPCRAVEPIVYRLAEEHAGKLLVLKVNGDDNVELIKKLGIRGYPTLMIFKGGAPVDHIPGAPPANVLADMVSKHLN